MDPGTPASGPGDGSVRVGCLVNVFGVGVCVGVGECVGVCVGVGESVGVGVGVCVGVGECVGVGVGVRVGVGVGVGVCVRVLVTLRGPEVGTCEGAFSILVLAVVDLKCLLGCGGGVRLRLV